MKNRKGTMQPINSFSSRDFYELLLSRQKTKPPKYKEWEKITKTNISHAQWKSIFLDLYSSNTNQKIFNVQWKLLHLSLPTTQKLHKIKILNSGTCVRCGEEEETHIHWFYTCNQSRILFKYLIKLMNKIYPQHSPFPYSFKLVLFGLSFLGSHQLCI